MALLAGCGTGATLKPKPGAVAAPAAPSCSAQAQREIAEGHGRLGACAPRPKRLTAPRGLTGVTGPDTSNNDPIYEWRGIKAHGHPFGWVKINQGTGFIDRTAAGQVRAMRAAGVVAGGYDFLEVCRHPAASEAWVFASLLKGLATTLVPVGDAEWPLQVPCSAGAARHWLATWQAEVQRLTGRSPAIYTGAWWWNPNIGCYWPGNLSWISGYGVGYPYMPCGLRHLDVWQYTDHGYNGASYTDMSVLRVPLASLTTTPPSPNQKRARLHSDYRLRTELRADLTHRNCRTHPRAQHRAVCRRWKHRGDEVNADITRLHREGVF